MLRIVFVTCLIAGASLLPASQGAPTKNDKNVITCAACERFLEQVLTGIQNDATNEAISEAIADACVSLGIYTYKTCYGTALIAMPTVRFIVSSTEFIEGNFCGIFAQSQDCGLSDPDKIEWTIRPSSVPKPPVTLPNTPPQGSPTLKVLHLADVHWDPEYLDGSLANCEDSVCCRASSGPVVDPADAAGYWGDYRTCDSPRWTVENAVAQIALRHPDIDYIVWTGDLVPHDLWDTTKEENIMINDFLLTLMKRYFPNTPLYPTLGNHESHPVNTFSPPEITDSELSTSWLYDEADFQWSRWLPAEVSDTVRYGGYYTTLVRPGLRIVSMNMNYCYTLNWWTLYNSKDPASGLAWLNQVLEQAERDGEKVHILSHIPPGNADCWTVFSREFGKIINRFESTVAAQFYGHTHNEEYKIFYDAVEKTRATNVAFVGGSLTTYSSLNPGYRIYTVDGERSGSSFAVLDFTTWYMNLTAANLQGSGVEPLWDVLYSAKQEYGLASLSPASMDNLFQRMLTDENLFQLYYKNFVKAGDPAMEEGCDARCRADRLCFIVTTDMGDRSRCDQIRRLLDA